MQELTLKRTSLSTTTDVVETLSWKLKSLQEDNKPVQEALADYIGLSITELDGQLSYIKEVKAEIASREKAIKEQKEAILEGAAKFLLDTGIDRLSGVAVSSITITKEKPASTKEKYTLLVDKKEAEQYLIDAGLAVMETVEVPETKAKVRVNKRKIALAEVVEG